MGCSPRTDPILEEEISSSLDNEDVEEEKEPFGPPRSFDEKQALFDQFAVNFSKTKLVSGLNERPGGPERCSC